MGVNQQSRQMVSAVVGAVDWLAEQAEQTWQRRDRWSEYVSDAYNELVERGESRLGDAERETRRRARGAERAARRVPGVAPLEGEARGLVAEPGQLPITGYEKRNAEQIVRQLPELSQRELHEVEGYESTHQARATVLRRIEELRGEEPWPAYDEMNADEILARLRETPPERQTAVAEYEQRHKRRRTVLDATG